MERNTRMKQTRIRWKPRYLEAERQLQRDRILGLVGAMIGLCGWIVVIVKDCWP